MGYLPKSSYKIKEASKGEFVRSSTDEPYEGPYIELDNGKYYAGNNYLDLGVPIKKPESLSDKFDTSKSSRKYHILKNNIFKSLKKLKTIVPTKSRPTEKDYEKGYMFRYFVQKVNDRKQLFEISQKTFDEFQQKYDGSLYQKDSLMWTLEGNVRKTNKLMLERQIKNYPHIKNLFSILNEFESMSNTGNLFTSGGELYYKNGREYSGPYHIHSESGPMVGAQHVEELHETLVWAKDLQSPNELKGKKDINYEQFLKSKKKTTILPKRKSIKSSMPDIQPNVLDKTDSDFIDNDAFIKKLEESDSEGEKSSLPFPPLK